MLVIRFADRFGKGIRISPRDALIVDSIAKEERGKAYGFVRPWMLWRGKAYIVDIVPEGHSTAMGTFNALTGLAALPASVIAGFLWQAFGPAVDFGTSGVIALISAVLLILIRIYRGLPL